MPSPPEPARRRGTRQERAVRNDERIAQATVEVLDEAGWDHLTTSGVARRADLNASTVTARHARPDRLAASTWRARLAQPVTAALTRLLEVGDTDTLDSARLLEALHPFMSPDQEMRAAAEVLLVASYEPTVADAITDTLGPLLSAWFTPVRGQLTRAQAARHAFLVSMALGFVLEARRYGALEADFDPAMAGLARALRHPTAPARLPAAQADYLDAPMEFDTGDEAWDAILRATLDCVGDSGYDKATIEAISAASGYTRTVIFTRYRSKQDLFMDATDRVLARNVGLTLEYQRAIEAHHGPGIADSCYIRETLRPERTRIRTIVLEQVRLAFHNQELKRTILQSLRQLESAYAAEDPQSTPAQIRGRLITEIAVTTGAGALAQLRDDIWDLPYDTILVPWRTGD